MELLVAGENVEPALLAEVSALGHPPRVIGVYRRADLPPWEERLATLALWKLSDPGNVGTVLRGALAFGVGALVFTLLSRAAIAGEGLGRDSAPDILVVSLSGHDYVNHSYGAESRLSHDHLLRLDRMFDPGQ